MASAEGRAPPRRLKFIARWGGELLPGPGLQGLQYVGGEAKLITAPRNVALSQLLRKLGSLLSGREHMCAVKFHLPGTGLDELVDLADEDDLEMFVEEHDDLARLSETGGGADSKKYLRVFLVPRGRASFATSDYGMGGGSEFSFRADTVDTGLDTASERSELSDCEGGETPRGGGRVQRDAQGRLPSGLAAVPGVVL